MTTTFRHLALLGVLASTTAVAQPAFEDLDRLDRRVTAALGADVGEPGGPLRPIDRRLRLAACPAQATISVPQPSAAVIECRPLGWRINVPLSVAVIDRAARTPREPVVRKGELVEVVADGGSFTVSTVAVAQQDGAAGEMIRLRADGRAAPIVAEVQSPGRAVIARFK